MLIRWLLAAIHLLAFGFALASILRRTSALRRCNGPVVSPEILRTVFRADAIWGLSALALIVTGLTRAFGGVEKGAAYYLHEPLFLAKMGALILILLFEIPPMVALIKWRIELRKGGIPDFGRAMFFANLGVIQAWLLVVMVFAASGMARGIGLPSDAV
ncbi:DUF2214 family protein [Paraburkholderia sp.]|uniref:DUF2214 family protein n=1 Tax=Paraburkholderia sp. TaxID=1926495 RepID=UPI00239C273E|nr:DUF2214 family protein [Paraburkholderia sp.]MDE1183713.1 DUF2214 family protein [Paraburkholderia sp.]